MVESAGLPGFGGDSRPTASVVGRSARSENRAANRAGRRGGTRSEGGTTTQRPSVPANGEAVTSAQSLQRLMIGDAIGEPLALTVLRSEALVDVIVSPEELKADE